MIGCHFVDIVWRVDNEKNPVNLELSEPAIVFVVSDALRIGSNLEVKTMKTRLNTTAQLMSATIASMFLLVMTGCNSAATPSSIISDQGVAPQPANAPALSNSEKPTGGNSASGDKAASAALTARLIVRNATLILIVDDTQSRVDAITKLASDAGGYVVSSSSTKYDAGLQSRLSLRIPSDKFDAAMSSIRKQAVEVREETISGEDVTAEFTDLSSQLKNLEAAELQLRDIMSKTVKTDDVLSVYNALTQKRGEIEQVKGRMQFLSQSAAMATINITLMPDTLAQPVQIAGWRPEGVAKSAIEALVGALQGIASLVIWLVIVIIPVLLILASPFIALGLILRRRNKRKKAQQQTTTPAAPPPSQNTSK